MSKIDVTFARLRAKGRKALIPFVTAGDPDVALTVPLMHALVRGGADIIELGVPFSDPMADGPTIQRASERALAKGMSLAGVLACVHAFREADAATPVVLMGYANPVESMGLDTFAAAAQAAGVDGVLIVDYPPEEAEAFAPAMLARGLDPIFLIAPTTTETRIAAVARLARGYIYYVSIKGVTGARHLDVAEVAARLAQVRAHATVPVGVGFGIRDAETAGQVASVADAVVVGSRLIEEIERVGEAGAVLAVETLLRSLRDGVDQGARKGAT